jgi:hypothetical protein
MMNAGHSSPFLDSSAATRNALESDMDYPFCGLASSEKTGSVGASTTGVPFWDFFTGGGHYMPRTHCVILQDGSTDWPWVIALMVLSFGVVALYLRIF